MLGPGGTGAGTPGPATTAAFKLGPGGTGAGTPGPTIAAIFMLGPGGTGAGTPGPVANATLAENENMPKTTAVPIFFTVETIGIKLLKVKLCMARVPQKQDYRYNISNFQSSL